jgi:hypothetical protein
MFKVVEKNIGSFQSSYFHFLVCRFPYFFFDYWDNQHVSLGVISIFTLYRLSFSVAVSECHFMPIEQFLGYIMV